MFGIKIISDREYRRMEGEIRTLYSSIEPLRMENKKLGKDLESLRDQLNDSIKEVQKLRQFKRDTLEALSDIDLGDVRIKLCSQKCDKCGEESKDCSKYEYGEHAFCVFRLNK